MAGTSVNQSRRPYDNSFQSGLGTLGVRKWILYKISHTLSDPNFFRDFFFDKKFHFENREKYFFLEKSQNFQRRKILKFYQRKIFFPLKNSDF